MVLTWAAPGGTFDVYTLLGPTGAERGTPLYSPREQLLQIVWHEFSHAFVNSLGYKHWLDCANEHIIRAIVARLAYHHLGPEAGSRALREDSSRGFHYIHALARRLEEYETHRNAYPTLAAFFPQLIDIFAELQNP